MKNTLNNEECIRIIEAERTELPRTSTRRGIFFSSEENQQHIRALYEKWKKNNTPNVAE